MSKEEVIETAGKTWRTLAEKGETSIADLAKILQQEEELVCQAIGWLAREDKINYNTRNNKTMVSLVESEIRSFAGLMQQAQAGEENPVARKSNALTGKTKNTRRIS